jgi:hypothetical protein
VLPWVDVVFDTTVQKFNTSLDAPTDSPPCKFTQCCCPYKIPCPTRASINPPLVPVPIDPVPEENITRPGIDEREVSMQDAPPATCIRSSAVHVAVCRVSTIDIRSPVAKESLPFFFDKLTRPKVAGRGIDDDHVDPMDELGGVAKICYEATRQQCTLPVQWRGWNSETFSYLYNRTCFQTKCPQPCFGQIAQGGSCCSTVGRSNC